MDAFGKVELSEQNPHARLGVRDASWSVRTALGSQGRPALEVYVEDVPVAVMVPTDLSTGALRGCCSATGQGGRRFSLAWGTLEAGHQRAPEVMFGRRRMHRVSRVGGETYTIGGRFWISAADGRFSEVTVTLPTGATERHTVPAR